MQTSTKTPVMTKKQPVKGQPPKKKTQPKGKQPRARLGAMFDDDASTKAKLHVGVPAAVRKVRLNTTNLGRVINAILQSSVTYGGSTVADDTNNNDMANTYALLWRDLQLGMAGKVSLMTKTTNFYRHLFEAVTPTTTKTAPSLTYQFDETSFNATPYPVDDVAWGKIEMGSYDDSGLGTVGVFNPDPDLDIQIASAGRIWERFNNNGHAMWNAGDKPTDGLDDPSVYAGWVTAPGLGDFYDSCGAVGLECSIRTTWLACLGLTQFTTNRVQNYMLPVYSMPQSYMGHRILTQFVGREGCNHQVKVQSVNANAFMYQAAGTFVSGAVQLDQSAIINGGNVWQDQSLCDVTQLAVYLANVMYTATIRESGVTLGYKDIADNGVCVAWGNQYYPRDMATTSQQNYFAITVENLRRLKVVSEAVDGVQTYTYNVFYRYNWSADYFPGFFYNVQTIPNLDYIALVDKKGRIVQFNSDGTGTTGAYFTAFNQAVSIMGSYTPMRYVTNEREKSVQLTNVVRIIPTYAVLQKFFEDPVNFSLGRKSSIEGKGSSTRTRNLGNLFIKIRNEHSKPSLIRKPMVKDNSLKVGGSGSGVFKDGGPAYFFAIGTRRVEAMMSNSFLSMVLPTAYGDQFSNADTIEGVVASPVSRLGLRSHALNNGLMADYNDAIYSAAVQMVGTRDSPKGSSELALVLDNMAKAGLGGALGSAAGWVAGKILGPKAGSATTNMVNGVVDTFRQHL